MSVQRLNTVKTHAIHRKLRLNAALPLYNFSYTKITPVMIISRHLHLENTFSCFRRIFKPTIKASNNAGYWV